MPWGRAVIKYMLACAEGHQFESWFADSAAYDKQAKKKLIACPVCNSTRVGKAIMAPRLSGTRKRGRAAPEARLPVPAQAPAPVVRMTAEEKEFRRKLKELRDHIVKNADNVGARFPEEARRMHYGEIEHRSIYGEASPEEARKLIEEGIEFHPLPVLPDDRN